MAAMHAQLGVMEASSELLQACGHVLHKAERHQRPRLAQPSTLHTMASMDRRADSLLQARQLSGLQASTSQSTSSSRTATKAAATDTPQLEDPPGPRDDDCLPDSLSEALVHAANATNQALDGPGGRYLCEILVPELWSPASGAIFAEEGDQQRFWRMTRKYAETLSSVTEGTRMKVLYPDAGTAAMLKNQWQDTPLIIASIKDRNPVEEEDEIVLLAAPDPQSLNESRRIAEMHDEDKHIIMFNPRLMSFDVGVGLASRRLRDQFLATFQVTYALKPVGENASLFRAYPDPWKVFVADEASVGRYMLAAQMASPPPPDVLKDIVQKASRPKGVDGEPQEEGLFAGVASRLGSFSKFLTGLSR